MVFIGSFDLMAKETSRLLSILLTKLLLYIMNIIDFVNFQKIN